MRHLSEMRPQRVQEKMFEKYLKELFSIVLIEAIFSGNNMNEK